MQPAVEGHTCAAKQQLGNPRRQPSQAAALQGRCHHAAMRPAPESAPQPLVRAHTDIRAPVCHTQLRAVWETPT